MNKKRELEQFSQDIDNIILKIPSIESEQWTEAYRREMELVRELTSVDFSRESREKQTIKSRLLYTHIDVKEQPMIVSLFQKSFVRASIFLLILLLVLAISPLGSGLAQTLARIVQQWQIGDFTKAVSVEGNFEAAPDENGETIILPDTELSNNHKEIAPAQESGAEQQRQITLEPTLTFAQAQQAVKFRLVEPDFLPDGYEFQGVVVINIGQASLEYVSRSENRLLGLLQTAVGGEDGQVQLSFSSDMVVEEIEVNGQSGLWTQAGDEGLLIWEDQAVNYQLIGLDELEVALRVAESLN